ncbi:MAG TPA: hypothetical protein VJ259_07445 [Actinomycetota bacterium]|nr:hypothetical protein [Actinomycetota bacterium]
MTRELDWVLFEKAVDITASAVRGTLGGENSQPPKFAADVFREVWAAMKQASEDLPERGRPGF